MNSNRTATTIISVVVVLLLLSGVYYLATSGGRDNTADYTAPETNDQNNNQGSAPAAVTKEATFVSQSTAVLNGEVNPMGAQTSYWYEYGQTSTLGSFTSPQLIGGGNIVYKAPKGISGLKASSTYYYRLASENEHGKVFGDVISFTTTNTAPITYVSPLLQTKDATAITQNGAILNGSFNPNGPAASYWFEYGKSFNLGSVTPIAAASGTTAAISVATALSGLKPDTTYYYRLDGQNVYGTVTGNISVFTTQPENPAAPSPTPTVKAPTVSTASATVLTSHGATLNGKVNPNGVTTTYFWKYGKSTPFGVFTLNEMTASKQAGAGKVALTVSSPIADLDSNSTYYFQLVAENDNGTTLGAIYSFTTKGN